MINSPKNASLFSMMRMCILISRVNYLSKNITIIIIIIIMVSITQVNPNGLDANRLFFFLVFYSFLPPLLFSELLSISSTVLATLDSYPVFAFPLKAIGGCSVFYASPWFVGGSVWLSLSKC